jgi:molybdopterin synthase catalytic subunit
VGCSVRLEHEQLDPERELRQLISSSPGAGAVVSFVGMARSQGDQGAIEALVLEHHPVLTRQSMSAIANEALERFKVRHVSVVHRCGAIAPGEPIVFAGAASEHRRPAFEAADFLMDRLKTDAVFWKREEGPEGRRWIEPTVADYEARERWEG